MKLFRVHLFDGEGNSSGFKFTSSKGEAEKIAKANVKESGRVFSPNLIEEREFVIGKYEVLGILDLWASHPNNG